MEHQTYEEYVLGVYGRVLPAKKIEVEFEVELTALEHRLRLQRRHPAGSEEFHIQTGHYSPRHLDRYFDVLLVLLMYPEVGLA